MKYFLSTLIFFVTSSFCHYTFAQFGIGGSPNPSAILDLKSPNNDKVFLPPRLNTAQRTGINNPPAGGLVYDTDKNLLYIFDGKNWVSMNSSMIVHDANKLSIPIGGNSWVTSSGATSDIITELGIVDWQNSQTILSTYVGLPQAGKIKVSVSISVPTGESKFSMTINGKLVYFTARGSSSTEYFVDEWNISNAGYVKIDLQAISKTGSFYGSVDAIQISGTSSNSQTAFVPNNTDNYFLWGRRGPSVHLRYDTQNINNVEWFYNEITVPSGNDVIGSYFMADGFNEGYFGMQVNGPNSRQILFSVWSPSNENDPTKVPENLRVKLIRKGENVVTGEFGNEGVGGQSYLPYNWKAGNTYKFLIRGRPVSNNNTEYTAYFYAPEDATWKLIASFLRPSTNTYLTSLYSFLENFDPNYGNKERLFNLTNQWAYASGKWFELNKVTLTGDETANRRYRIDYAGGLSNGRFYLRNCGFFNDFTSLNGSYTRPSLGIAPSINFNSLP